MPILPLYLQLPNMSQAGFSYNGLFHLFCFSQLFVFNLSINKIFGQTLIWFQQTGQGESDANIKLQKLLYLLDRTLPLLRHIHGEQCTEIYVEAQIRGILNY